MNTQKIVLGILGLVIVLGLVFLAVKSNKNMEQNTPPPAQPPVTPVDNTPKPTAEFDKTVTLRVNDKVTFSDGLSVVLKEINDSRCKPNVQCIWAGELSGKFSVYGGRISVPAEITLGTINNQSVTLGGYVFSLKSATETSISIAVRAIER